MDYWTFYYAQNPNASDNEFDNPDFDADVAELFKNLGQDNQPPAGKADDDWEEIPL